MPNPYFSRLVTVFTCVFAAMMVVTALLVVAGALVRHILDLFGIAVLCCDVLGLFAAGGALWWRHKSTTITGRLTILACGVAFAACFLTSAALWGSM